MVQVNREQGILMLLAGISEMVNPEYTKGNWKEESTAEESDGR